MPGALKVTISLPSDLHEAAERERKARKETRSQFFRHAVESFLKERREREAAERYVQGYRAQPEREPEVAAVHEASRATLASEPWECRAARCGGRTCRRPRDGGRFCC